MVDERHHRLTERDGVEMGIHCPDCGTYTSFDDVLATGACHGDWKGCQTGLRLDFVVVE